MRRMNNMIRNTFIKFHPIDRRFGLNNLENFLKNRQLDFNLEFKFFINKTLGGSY